MEYDMPPSRTMDIQDTQLETQSIKPIQLQLQPMYTFFLKRLLCWQRRMNWRRRSLEKTRAAL